MRGFIRNNRERRELKGYRKLNRKARIYGGISIKLDTKWGWEISSPNQFSYIIEKINTNE